MGEAEGSMTKQKKELERYCEDKDETLCCLRPILRPSGFFFQK